MAELAVIMSMLTVTSTAASVLGIIKRRCGASQTIFELASNCAELVDKIRTLLKTLEGDAQVPCDARRISTALRLRREEFDDVLKNLDKLKQHTKRTHPVDRTEKFIKAQGWAKRMEAIYNNLVQLRNGIENIVSNWDAAQFLAAKFDEIVTIDVTKREESGKCEHLKESQMMGSGTVNYVDRIQMTMVKLTKANREALNRYGYLDVLSLPDALFEAGEFVCTTNKTNSIQLMQLSAELLNPLANSWMGTAYKYGYIMKKDLNLALTYFRAACSRGEILSTMELMSHYNHENDMQKVLKYVKAASCMTPKWIDQILYEYYPIGYNFENGELDQHLINASQSMCALDQSSCHFHGFWARKSRRKAVEALQTIDFGSYRVHFDADSNSLHIRFCIRPHNYGWYYYEDLMPEYLDFLFESNQFLPFFIWSHDTDIYSPRKWKRYALDAAKGHCVDAHIFLAEHYSSLDHRNEHEMKRHLRIAADAGHAQAQSICRQLFGRKANTSKGVKLIDVKRNGNQGKERQPACMKQTKKKEGDSRKKRTTHDKKKLVIAT